MTRIFNFAILLALAGIFYVQTDGFGANTVSANAQVAQVQTQPRDVQHAAVKVSEPAVVRDLPKLPIAAKDMNALSSVEKAAIQERFVAQRLAASTVIRSVKLTKSPIKVAATSSDVTDGINNLRVTGNVVNARSKPTTNSKVIAKLRKGTEVVSTGQSEGKWAEVIVVKTGQSVWMHSDFLAAQS